jgi:predicted nucleotidyltransferase
MLSNPIHKAILTRLKNEVKAVLKENFIGAYVHGSLATGDSVAWSDLDIVVVIKEDISAEGIEPLQLLHHKLYETLESPWGQRLELSYVPIEIFRKRKLEPRDPPHEPRSNKWVDPSTQAPPQFYPFWYLDNGADNLVRSEHDNTQIVRWVVREKGIILEGPDPKDIIDPISKTDLISDMKNTFKLISDKWNNPESLNSLGMQTFFVTLCCRAQHCLHTGIIASKKVASEWAQQALGEQYRELIKEAYQSWLRDRSSLFAIPSNSSAIRLTMALINDTSSVLNDYHT